MRRVMQTVFGGADKPIAEQGNCLAASMASILNLDLEEVELYTKGIETIEQMDNIWWDKLQLWLKKRHLCALYLPWGDKATPDQYAYGKPGFPYIACGKGPRGDNHAVVYKDGELLHDPHPKALGLAEVEAYIIFVPLFDHHDTST